VEFSFLFFVLHILRGCGLNVVDRMFKDPHILECLYHVNIAQMSIVRQCNGKYIPRQ
jgi:hypothetical protein